MNSTIRILLALVLGFVIAFVIALANSGATGAGFVEILQGSLFFALLVGIIVAVLSWGMDVAIKKGYPGWMGFLLALIPDNMGLDILLLLPRRSAKRNKPQSR